MVYHFSYSLYLLYIHLFNRSLSSEKVIERTITMNGKYVTVNGNKVSFKGKLFDKQWHLVTLKMDSSSIELMLDGQKTQSITITSISKGEQL